MSLARICLMPTNEPGVVCGERAGFWCHQAKDTCRDCRSSCCLPITPDDLDDAYVEMRCAMAIKAEDADIVYECDTILCMNVQPELKRAARERLFMLLVRTCE